MSHSEASTGEASFSWWIRKAKQGDRAAFDRCVKDVRPRIRSHCIRLLNGLEAEGEQAAQDTLLKAWRNIDTLRLAAFREDAAVEKRRFESWVMSIATNHCRNIPRTPAGREPFTGKRADPEVLERWMPPDPGFEQAVIERGKTEHLRRTICECEKKAKPRWDALDVWLYRLFYESEVETVQEAVKIVGRHRDTVTSRLRNHIRPVVAAAYAHCRREWDAL